MNYNDIKQRIYDLLDMPIAEAVRAGYAGKIHRAFNEATFTIAHSLLPNLREYHVSLTADKMPARVIMPPDFISFADEQNAYCNGKNFILTKFEGLDGINLDGTEGLGKPYKYTENDIEVTTLRYDYTIYYNALYPEIIDGGKNYQMVTFVDAINEDGYKIEKFPTEVIHNNDDTSIQWPSIVSQLAPHYVVAQLLARDDKVRSIAEMNNFESLLAKVNVERKERQREYRSVRGWY